jgi:hypothetical protein
LADGTMTSWPSSGKGLRGERSWAAWLAMLLAAAGWAFLSAVEVDACAFEGAQRAAWGWVASFATSSLLAALSFAALV